MSITYNPDYLDTPYTYVYNGDMRFTLTASVVPPSTLVFLATIPPISTIIPPGGWSIQVLGNGTSVVTLTIISPKPLTTSSVFNMSFSFVIDGTIPESSSQYTFYFPALVYNPDTASPNTFSIIAGQPADISFSITTNDLGHTLTFDGFTNASNPPPSLAPWSSPTVSGDPTITTHTTGTPTATGNYSFVFMTEVNSIDPIDSAFVLNTAAVSVIVCLDRSSCILMADGTEKPIYEIKRGDIVMGHDKCYQVARLLINHISPDLLVNVCTINEPKLGSNRKLILTHNHSIIYNGARRYASKFVQLDGVGQYNIKASEILTPDPNGLFALYDLQFETLGSYIANGVTVQSRSPRSFNTPLPQNEYFNVELYRPDLMDDHDPEYEQPLLYDLVEN